MEGPLPEPRLPVSYDRFARFRPKSPSAPPRRIPHRSILTSTGSISCFHARRGLRGNSGGGRWVGVVARRCRAGDVRTVSQLDHPYRQTRAHLVLPCVQVLRSSHTASYVCYIYPCEMAPKQKTLPPGAPSVRTLPSDHPPTLLSIFYCSHVALCRLQSMRATRDSSAY